jgi:hypothetical protein
MSGADSVRAIEAVSEVQQLLVAIAELEGAIWLIKDRSTIGEAIITLRIAIDNRRRRLANLEKQDGL